MSDDLQSAIYNNRLKEINSTINEFSKKLGNICDPLPINQKKDLNFEDDETDEYSSLEENQEHPSVSESALLIIADINQLLKETYQFSNCFKSKHINKRPELAKLYKDLLSLIDYIEKLRIRAEKLLSMNI